MTTCTHIFQISGMKIREEKKVLIQGIQQLGGKYIGGLVYRNDSTHLIVPQVLSSEKFLAACAAGKWVVTPNYVLDSVKNSSWLAEGPFEVTIPTCATSTFYPVRQWREKVASGRITGAFQGWRVLLMIQEPTRRAMFKRLLKAGRAKVYHNPPPSHASLTHVMVKPMTEASQSHNAPCYPVSHIVQHLFGQSNLLDMKFDIIDDHQAVMKKAPYADFNKLETELKNYANKHEARPRLLFLEFLGYHDPYCPKSQPTETDFSNVGSMLDCGMHVEALDALRSTLFPGLLPPAPYLISLLEFVLQGNATFFFLKNLQQVMLNLLITNPPWLAPRMVKKYYAQVLQCPHCKTGLWPFLKTAISYCLSSDVTCHPLPGPALPTLLQFQRNLLGFFLKLFQGELHSVTACDFMLPERTRVSQASASGYLLYGTFWTVWERSTLLTRAVKELTQLLVQAAVEDYTEGSEKQELHLADTLLEVLSVLVEFWCQQHIKLNQNLVENGLKDLAEHLSVISHDVSPLVLAEIIVRIRSTRLKLVIVDAIFRGLCSKSGFIVGDDPLSLKKMVLSYLPALGIFARSPVGVPSKTGRASHSDAAEEPDNSAQSFLANEASLEKKTVPKGWNKVNAAGETLLHRACKKNQVDTVLQILALPGTDVNVEDHAGWTPLHEACNHGSTACVDALLRHHPPPALTSQVGGVSPLHDALLNGHMDIATLLLEHGGSALLQQTDGDGHTPLDLVPSSSQREELLRSAQVADSALRNLRVTEVLNLPLLEAGSTLLAHLMFSYHQERGLTGFMQLSNRSRSLVSALVAHSLQNVKSGWIDQRAVRLVEDTQTLLELGRGNHLGQVSQAVKECKGENTMFLMEMVENLRSCGEALLADL